jgi:hypothetical protein
VKARRAAELLAEVPESERSAEEHRHHDEAQAVSALIASPPVLRHRSAGA